MPHGMFEGMPNKHKANMDARYNAKHDTKKCRIRHGRHDAKILKRGQYKILKSNFNQVRKSSPKNAKVQCQNRRQIYIILMPNYMTKYDEKK